MRTLLLLTFTLMSGCATYDRLGNKPYSFPDSSEPHAEVTVSHYKKSYFSIYNMDDNGCFAGTSKIFPPEGPVKIHANTAVFLSLEHRLGGSICNLIFSFIPEQNSKYSFTQAAVIDRKPGVSGFLSGTKIYCALKGEKALATGEKQSLQLKQMLLRPSGLACLRMREVSHNR